jgi:hypothetical protein
MPDLSAVATLDLWETGDELGPVERSLALAAAADPLSGGLDELAQLPLGRRDARLLTLHESLAGGRLEATAACAACGEQAEFSVEVSELLAREPDSGQRPPVEEDGFVVHWRSPDSSDVSAAAATGDAADAEQVLLARCVTAATGPDGVLDAAALPESVRREVSRVMGDADPLAEVLVNVVCPACETEFVADLDVGTFVWAEVHARAQRLLHEVDVLARAYGWTEAEVLSLGDHRREAYLALADEGGQ